MVPAQTQLIDFVTEQRWYGSKTRDVTDATVVDHALLREVVPHHEIALVEIRFGPGTHETYQLLWTLRDDGVELDGLSDPDFARELVHAMRGGITLPAEEGTISFYPVEGFAALGQELQNARVITGEQSNSSVVFDDELILKCYRRLEPGVNPELEMLRFLTERGFEHIAQLGGWYEYSGAPLDATLGILQQYVRGGLDGWELALDELEQDPDRFVGRVRRLGEVTGAMHTTLGSDPTDTTFAPEEPSAEALGLLTATVDEEIESIFLTLPDDPTVAPLVGRGEEVREQLRQLTHIGSFGNVIRHHGDYHLGQTLVADGDWIILDFEGEPARSLPERRRKRSPLRDVAGMMRSFAYAASAAEILRGKAPPADWEERARAEFLEGYLDSADPRLLPGGRDGVERLLAVFELEKAVYELRYELNNRPDWVRIPVAGILRLLETRSLA